MSWRRRGASVDNDGARTTRFAMEISEIIPRNGEPQRIYCDQCGMHSELCFFDFDKIVSGIAIKIAGLPVLKCPECGREQLPERSRVAIVMLHQRAWERSLSTITVPRNKCIEDFGFTKIKFQYDADDYFYFPGLVRPHNRGFLQPVFFRRGVLLKYDNAPGYRVRFASTTYGMIITADDQINFGVNRHGNVVMWLGDIAKLPEDEQYYLRSENILSDHALGSEFYDGQIEVKFTDNTKEDQLFRARSEFLNDFQTRFGVSAGHLEAEAFDIALSFNPPIVDTPKERRHVADTLNKVYLESLDRAALSIVLKDLGKNHTGLGSIKLLQGIIEAVAPSEDVILLLLPLYVLYDFRVLSSHLVSDSARSESVNKRLGLLPDASIFQIYSRLRDGLLSTFIGMSELVKVKPPH